MSGKRTIDERIEAHREEKRQIEARIKKLMQEQRTQKNKERTHRLCKRGGLIEKYLPDLIKLSDDQFQVFINKCLLSNFTMKALSELSAPNGSVDIGIDNATKQNDNNPVIKTTATAEVTHIAKSSDTAA